MALGEKYDFQAIEKKWQARWREADLYRATLDPDRPKFYGLEMFPYPSGKGLSVGHFKNYAPNDAFLRYKSMCGYNVLHPMGWDAFGQPAENEAIKRQRQPRETVREYAANYKRQLQLIGMAYDWDREINSSDPSYYKWTQWIFLLLHHRGLAYRANAPVNWCPNDRTVLANEEVVNGRCWRCDTPVVKRQMPQWFFRITAYAERLLADLDTLDWSEGIKAMQRNWIGRSEGAYADFPLTPSGSGAGGASIRVFTTRPDTLWGATFMVLAPEHPLVPQITTPEQLDAVEAYRTRAERETEIERQAEGREKTGVFTGAYAVNPVNGERIPIWVADYVLMGYGTGAIMAVPAHDQRDFEFARKFGLPIVPVYQEPGREVAGEEMTQATTDKGVLVHSGPFDGLAYSKETVAKVAAWLKEQGTGEPVVTYKLRDWLISRQRYWGAPIPVIHCAACGEVPVPEDQLPVTLPDVENYQPSGTGESPLATIPEWVNTTCPGCGGPARRETDTMGGFACSSWYFLRFADPHNDREAFSREAVDYWLPVDTYAGGAEHAVMHLLYARFWTKALYDAGLLSFVEPFKSLHNQGMMLAWTPGRRPAPGEDAEGEENDEQIEDWKVLKPEERAAYPPDQVIWRWVKMSKSKGNVVTPDDMAAQFGADSLRVYEMFVAPFEETVQWSEEGIRGSSKFLGRVYRLIAQYAPGFSPDWRDRLDGLTDKDKALRRKTHQTIPRIADDLENFRFNTAVAGLMEWTNAMYEVANALPSGQRSAALDEAMELFVPVLAPFAPHLADELWTEGLGQSGFLYKHPWPEADPEVARNEEITLVVQINGKVRDKLTAPADADKAQLEAIALASPRVRELLNGSAPKKVIVVPSKLVNVVI
ncbi:MAG: leucine--tRNA ligase [Armatimonadetes bacterium]|nr:leucine--tRNA ligase [Armatimonadota bacterium]